MVNLDRKILIKSQRYRFQHVYQDVNFGVWLAWGLVTLVAALIMYFFSINLGLWLEALTLFCCALYYLAMSFAKEKLELGYYQKILTLGVACSDSGLIMAERTKQEENKYLVAYNQIRKAEEYNGYINIVLANEGRIVLPNTPELCDVKASLSKRLGKRYRVIDR